MAAFKSEYPAGFIGICTLTTLEAAIERTLATVPVMAETVAALQTAPGVGPVVAIGLAALLPELGHTTGRKVAALVGVAPFDHDSNRKGRGPSILERPPLLSDATAFCPAPPVLRGDLQ